jgi:hypothetical protein
MRKAFRAAAYERTWLMKHISLTSKSMPAVAQDGGLVTPKNSIFPLNLIGFIANDFSFWPLNWLIVPLTGITKRTI